MTLSLSHSHVLMRTWWRVRWCCRDSVPKLQPLTVWPFIWESSLSHRQKTLIGIIPKNQRGKRQDTQLWLKSALYGPEFFFFLFKKSVKTRIMLSPRRTKDTRGPPSTRAPRPNFIPIKCFSTASQMCPADSFCGRVFSSTTSDKYEERLTVERVRFNGDVIQQNI